MDGCLLKRPRSTRAGRLVRAGAMLLVALILIWLYRRCDSESSRVPVRPAADSLPTGINQIAIEPGRIASLSERDARDADILNRFQQKGPALSSCLEESASEVLSYRLLLRWSPEGVFRTARANPEFSGAIQKCIDVALSDFSLRPDPGMREREFEVELRVR